MVKDILRIHCNDIENMQKDGTNNDISVLELFDQLKS